MQTAKQIHPYAEIFPAIEGSALHELMADIKANGLREAIWLHKDGRILDGRNRYVACCNLAITPAYRTYEGDDDLAFVLSMNLARRHLDDIQRGLVAAMIANLSKGSNQHTSIDVCSDEKLETERAVTQQQAAEKVNVSVPTVQRCQKIIANAEPEVLALAQRGNVSIAAITKIADKPREEQQKIMRTVELHIEAGKTVNDALKSMNVHVSNNSGENEWYTPENIIEAARAVMGSIDLDPASSEIANKTVKAGKIYTISDNGLDKEWSGNVWLNPPYSQPEISQFSSRLCEAIINREIEQACVLVNNATETKWCQNMLMLCSEVCFLSSRVKFLNPQGIASGAPLQGQIVIYFGKNRTSFFEEFTSLGVILGL